LRSGRNDSFIRSLLPPSAEARVARPGEDIIFSATTWRGKPLESPEVINLIAAITIHTGLKVYARLGH
jgi:hypothetical protein